LGHGTNGIPRTISRTTTTMNTAATPSAHRRSKVPSLFGERLLVISAPIAAKSQKEPSAARALIDAPGIGWLNTLVYFSDGPQFSRCGLTARGMSRAPQCRDCTVRRARRLHLRVGRPRALRSLARCLGLPRPCGSGRFTRTPLPQTPRA